MGQHHRYARPEVERRFLLATVPAGLPVGRLLVDRYLPGTRLRLREVREAGGEVTRKLGQRVREGTGPGRVWHTSVLLDEAEWALLSGLGGHPLVKARHTVWLDDDDLTVAVDVLAGRHTGTVLAEVDLHGRDRAEEADLTSALAAAGLDVVREVTREEDYTGGGLAPGRPPGPGRSRPTGAPAAASVRCSGTGWPRTGSGSAGSTSGARRPGPASSAPPTGETRPSRPSSSARTCGPTPSRRA